MEDEVCQTSKLSGIRTLPSFSLLLTLEPSLPVAVCVGVGYLTAMRFIGSVIEKLQRHPKRVVFPEGTEPRVLQAARQFHSLRLGVPILLGDRTKVKEAAERLNVPLEGVRI